MPRPTDALLLAAFPPELCGLDAAPPPGWRAACVGIGAVTAAIATARLLSERPAGRVLFVGTCGAYDARLAPGDLLAASEAIATSLEEREGRAYRPAAERVRWPASWVLGGPGGGEPGRSRGARRVARRPCRGEPRAHRGAARGAGAVTAAQGAGAAAGARMVMLPAVRSAARCRRQK